MKTFQSIMLFSVLLIFMNSCSKDFGTTTVQYNKITPVYETPATAHKIEVHEARSNIKDAGEIFVGSDYLYVGEENEGIHIVDNANPSQPQNIGFISIPGCHEFFVSENYLYANNYFDIVKMDITDISHPKLVARANRAVVEGELKGIDYEIEDKIFVGFHNELVTEELPEDSDVLQYVRSGQSNVYLNLHEEVVPPPSIPSSFVGNSSGVAGTTNRLAVYEDYLFVIYSSAISTFDGNLNAVSQNNRSGDVLETAIVKNDKLYVGDQMGMTTYDIQASGQLDQVSRFDHQVSCDPVLPVSDKLSYVTIRNSGPCPGDENLLFVVEENENTFYPRTLQTIQMRSPMGMTLVGDLLIVAEGTKGFDVFDTSNPRDLQRIYTETDIECHDVLSHPDFNDRLLVADGSWIKQFKRTTTDRFELISNFRIK